MFLYFTYNNLVYCNKINVRFSTPNTIKALSFTLHYAVSPTDKYTQKPSMDIHIQYIAYNTVNSHCTIK